MDCTPIREAILEALVLRLDDTLRREMEAHTATCASCREFAAEQRHLDARLAAAIPPEELSNAFRRALREKLRSETVSAWPDYLPDLAHFIGCAAACTLSVYLLPLPHASVILSGAAFTIATYLIQVVARTSLDVAEGDI
jgi:anti-sigma factor RsiW